MKSAPQNPSVLSTVPGTFSCGSIAGIPIAIHGLTPLFFIGTIAFVFVAGGVGLALFVVGAFFSLLLHEGGHALVAKRQGYTVRAFVIYPLSSVALIEEKPDASDEIKIALAGPAVSILLALSFFLYLEFQGHAWWNTKVLHTLSGEQWFVFLFFLNACVAVGNILPALPLDGGKVLYAFLVRKSSLPEAAQVMRIISIVFAFVFPVLGIAFKAPFLSVLGLLIFLGTKRELYREQAQQLWQGKTVADALDQNWFFVRVADRMHDAAKIFAETGQQYLLVMRAGEPVGWLSRGTVLRTLHTPAESAYVSEQMIKNVPTLQETESLTTAVLQLQANRGIPLCIRRGDQLLGFFHEESLRSLHQTAP